MIGHIQNNDGSIEVFARPAQASHWDLAGQNEVWAWVEISIRVLQTCRVTVCCAFATVPLDDRGFATVQFNAEASAYNTAYRQECCSYRGFSQRTECSRSENPHRAEALFGGSRSCGGVSRATSIGHLVELQMFHVPARQNRTSTIGK